MGPVEDLEDLRPVVAQVTRTAQHAQVDEGLEPSPGAGGGPLEPDRHVFHNRSLLRPVVGEPDLERGREERQVSSEIGIVHSGEHGPQTAESGHEAGNAGPTLSGYRVHVA